MYLGHFTGTDVEMMVVGEREWHHRKLVAVKKEEADAAKRGNKQ